MSDLYPGSKFTPERCTVEFFDSIEDYAATVAAIPLQYREASSDNSFYGRSFNDAVKLLNDGHLPSAAHAQKLFAEFEKTDLFVNRASIIETDIVGFTPVIPAALMGHPNSMLVRRVVERESQNTGINIFFEVGVSAGVSEAQIMDRGSAALALTMALNARRPVTLYAVDGFSLYGGKGSNVNCIKICDNILDLSRAAYILTSKDYARRLAFSYLYNKQQSMARDVGWPMGIIPTDKTYENSMRHAVNAQPDDIYMVGGYLADTLILKNPVQWVKNMIARFEAKEHTEENN